MSRLIFLFFISLVALNLEGQNKVEVSVGGGMILNHTTQSDFDSADRSFLEESKSTSISYGFNSFVSYFPHRNVMLRGGLIFHNVKFDGFTTIKSINSFSFPLFGGLKWKKVLLYSGIEYDVSYYSFISRENFGKEINKENCSCELSRNSYNIPLGFEYNLTKQFDLGLKYQFFTNEKVRTAIRKDELRNTYLYLNYRF